ncbi:MAG: formylglycine-generating enzyme family protein [Nitrospiria bacterium]
MIKNVLFFLFLAGFLSILLSLKINDLSAQNLPSKSFSQKNIEGAVFVKGGCYEMGDVFGDGDKNSKPVHTVCLNDFYFAKELVTLKEFKQFVDETHYQTEAEEPFGETKEPVGCVGWNGKDWKVDKKTNWRTPGFKQEDNHPVVCVTWKDSNKFAAWKNIKTSLAWRLPTEAEWEYAARNRGQKIKFSWGDGPPKGNVGDLAFKDKVPNNPVWEGYNDGYPFTSPVHAFKPNELGLFDMTGNVWEWVFDWFDEGYYKKSPKENPQGPMSGQMRVLRGGSWGNGDPLNIRTTYRGHFIPDARSSFLGFRLALTPVN